jgi:hypothetical protein
MNRFHAAAIEPSGMLARNEKQEACLPVIGIC